MNKLFLTESRALFKHIWNRSLVNGNKSFCSSSSSSSDSSDEDKKLKQKSNNKEALEKLNKLLANMTEDIVTSSKTKLNLATPTNKRQKGDPEVKKTKSKKSQTEETVKNIATALGGDVKRTQSELLTKLLSFTQGEKNDETNLNNIVKGMQIEQSKSNVPEPSKAEQVRHILKKRSYPKSRPFTKAILENKPREKINLFESEPLGVFTDINNFTYGVENKVWDELYKKDLKLAVTNPPSNYFQQMVLWTEQGKVWRFPIDNEQDLHEEKKVYFAEHVFLEKHLEPWCPTKGPLRHFMELVCVGLSKNPYLTAKAKKDHILWFKSYFDEKQQILKETGVIENSPKELQP